MGCDIHMYVEYKKTINKIEKWILGDYFKKNPHYPSKYETNEWERLELHGDRNYALFSLLAGVRDYTDKVVPVAQPKGIPEDTCDYIKQANEDWDSDGHSHSWLTLKEIRDYQNKKPTLYRTGLLAPHDLVAFDNEGKLPNSWCQGTNQEGYERREWEQESDHLVPLIEALQKRSHELHQYDWQEYDFANDEKTRIVFWFDN